MQIFFWSQTQFESLIHFIVYGWILSQKCSYNWYLSFRSKIHNIFEIKTNTSLFVRNKVNSYWKGINHFWVLKVLSSKVYFVKRTDPNLVQTFLSIRTLICFLSGKSYNKLRHFHNTADLEQKVMYLAFILIFPLYNREWCKDPMMHM